MSEPLTQPDAPRPVTRAPWRRGLGFALRTLSVRLRFVTVLLAAFLIVGQWSVLRNYWDKFTSLWDGSAAAQQAMSTGIEFFCPMDPGVVTDWPSICPICNMDLVQRQKGEAVQLPEGVVARMQLSPYRVQLAGIKTSVVTPLPLERVVLVSGFLKAANEEGAAGDPKPSSELLLVGGVAEPDLPFLKSARTATVTASALPGIEPFSATLESSDEGARGKSASAPRLAIQVHNREELLKPGMWATARLAIPLAEVEPYRAAAAEAGTPGILAVPETAVVDLGGTRVVYVETMPGMFDGIEVGLGPRCGDYYPVLKGIVAGQSVATAGAFLIDAEARLNPALAAGYFGASQRTGTAPAKPAAASPGTTPAPPRTMTSKLSAADEALAKAQRLCPVTNLPLNSMGGPVPVVVAGRKVFICCKGCDAKLRSDPQKYLARLPAPDGPATRAE